jgi:UDP-glucose 4-epimerase
MNKNTLLSNYNGKNILIIGGLGFIGSNLAHLLVEQGAKVTILDNLAPLYGGNLFNVEDIKDKVTVVLGDVRDEKHLAPLVKDASIIFNFAAQVSHIDSSNIPYEDLDISCRGHLTVLECVRKENPSAKVVFSSSRLVIGKIKENPITENHPTEPLSLYGVHKLAAENYSKFYNKNYGIKTVIMRIANPYGERQQIKHSKYSIPGWFMRLAMEGKSIKIFGNGEQLRDYIFGEDLVLAMALAGIKEKANGNIYNLGTGKSISFKEMVETIVRVVGNGSIEYVAWPENYEKEETGNCEFDISKIKKDLGWEPATSLEEGVKKMYAYYLKHSNNYIEKI